MRDNTRAQPKIGKFYQLFLWKCLRTSPTTLCHTWFTRRRRHIIDGSKGKFGRICSITNVYVKRGNRCFGYSLGFSWLWGHFEGFKFGVQGITLRVCGGENRSSIFGGFAICFKKSFNHPTIKIWKKSQPLWQHVENDHNMWKNVCQKNIFWAKK